MTPELVTKSANYGLAQHRESGQQYDGQPYSVHLEAVADWTSAKQFHDLLTADERMLADAGAYVHDVIDDCRVTFNDVATATSQQVAEIAYLLATPKGRNRKERHCDAYYHEISGSKVATFVKICDRIANVSHSRQKGGSMLALYQKEHAHFCKFLRPAWPEFDYPLGPWQVLEMLLDDDLHGE